METELAQAALLKQLEIKRLESISNLGNLDKLRKSEIQTVPALAKNLLGVFRSGNIPKGCRHIDDMAHLIGHARFDYTRPMCDKRSTNASFVIGRFEFAVGSIAVSYTHLRAHET